MTATVATDMKANMKYYIDKALDGDNVIITRPGRKNVVLISEEEYNELQRIRNNSDYLYKLERSFEEARQGKVVGKTMEELEAMEDEQTAVH